MSTDCLNDSSLNGSLHRTCAAWLLYDPDAGAYTTSIVLLSNFVVGFPANVWMVWLICHRTKALVASDIFLLSLAACEILHCLGLPAQLYCFYSSEHASGVLSVLLWELWILMWIGRPIFQSCICVDRYIAVVHPLFFIRLKLLKYKVAQCALPWFSFILTVLLIWKFSAVGNLWLMWFIPMQCMLFFCSISVLWSLKRPGPGERTGDERRRGDKMKRKAFNIILIQLACFLVNYLPMLVVPNLNQWIHISGIVMDLIINMGLVCGVVQPLHYLHRAGKLSCQRAVT